MGRLLSYVEGVESGSNRLYFTPAPDDNTVPIYYYLLLEICSCTVELRKVECRTYWCTLSHSL